MGRVYPSQSRRLAPDFGFHPQVYRADGETIALQPGKYAVTYTRGPEYLVLTQEITVPTAKSHTEKFRAETLDSSCEEGLVFRRSSHPCRRLCHYERPTEGVTPEDMMRHVLGRGPERRLLPELGAMLVSPEALFRGEANKLSTPTHLLRYDLEVSGFPSSHCGHICLLRLREQDYPGTKLIGDWPSWDLPIFRWAKAQGGVVGFAHCGWGLAPEA